MVVMAIMGIMAAIAVPELQSMREVMRTDDETHRLALTLGEMRTEAIRLRTNVRVYFTATGYRWDIYDDGTTDGSVSFPRGIVWKTTPVASILFNGLGIARSVTTTTSLIVQSGAHARTVQVNKNGFIWL